MNQKEFNNVISNISDFAGSYTQVLYQIIILLVIYNLFNNISFKSVGKHKPFILLVAIIVLGIDWFIWHNEKQTFLFGAVLFIYISYNFYLKTNMENYINIIEDCKKVYNHNKKMYDYRKGLLAKLHNDDEKAIKDLTYEPECFTNNTSKALTFVENPEPYFKSGGLNDLGIAYKQTGTIPPITDSKYAEVVLNALYDSSQYKAIKSNCIDPTLKNDIHLSPEVIIDINKFKNPEKKFLDDRWMKQKVMTYNDNCSGCRRTDLPKSKNAICTVVEFGNELENCTNQEGSIKPEQLDAISSNSVPSMNY